MNDKSVKDEIEVFLKELEVAPHRDNSWKTGRNLTLCMPGEYKDKFEIIQMRTDKKFGKKLKQLVSQAIDYALEKTEPPKAS